MEGGMDLIPGQGTKILCATERGQEKKKEKRDYCTIAADSMTPR